MKESSVHFYSDGHRLTGLLRLPDESPGPFPAVVQGPGWMGLKDAGLYLRYHEALTEAGIAVLIIDYRGFGDSEGDTRSVRVASQIDDLTAAVSYLSGRPEINGLHIGVFGSGGTGGGNAVLLAERDNRIRCVVAQVPIADGADWLRRMRSDGEWALFLQRLAADRVLRATTGEGEEVAPRTEITIPTAERKATTVKADVDGRVPPRVTLALADDLLAYRPLAVASRVGAILVIAVDDDNVTPTEHAMALYEAARTPKTMLLQRGSTHYAAYETFAPEVVPRIVDWFTRHLGSAGIDDGDGGVQILEAPA